MDGLIKHVCLLCGWSMQQQHWYVFVAPSSFPSWCSEETSAPSLAHGGERERGWSSTRSVFKEEKKTRRDGCVLCASKGQPCMIYPRVPRRENELDFVVHLRHSPHSNAPQTYLRSCLQHEQTVLPSFLSLSFSSVKAKGGRPIIAFRSLMWNDGDGSCRKTLCDASCCFFKLSGGSR
jgi:hypothetical protein